MKWTEERKIARSVLAKEKGYGKWMAGKKLSETTKKKLSEIKKGKPFSGKKCDWVGRKHSKESRLKMSLSAKGIKKSLESVKKRSGEYCILWKGGISKNRKEYYRFKCLERVARKKNAQGSHTQEEWIELKKRCNFKCLHCGKDEPTILLTQDHIIPLSKGGSDNIENIQPLCKSCNSRKGNKENPRTEISIYKLNEDEMGI
jgi:5-methylcytosine-specific restriction endonuclease McrA